jgi:hypothetical protein
MCLRASALRAVNRRELSDYDIFIYMWEQTFASSDTKNMAAGASAVRKQAALNLEFQYRRVNDQKSPAFAKQNSRLPCCGIS